jgi:hypothetical protein
MTNIEISEDLVCPKVLVKMFDPVFSESLNLISTEIFSTTWLERCQTVAEFDQNLFWRNMKLFMGI